MLPKSFCTSCMHNCLCSKTVLVQNRHNSLTWAPPPGFGAQSALARTRGGGSVSTGAWRLLGTRTPASSLAQGHASRWTTGCCGAGGGGMLGSQASPSCSNASRFLVSPLLRLPMPLVTAPGAPSLAPPDPFQDGQEDGEFKVMPGGNVKIFHFALSACPNAWLPSPCPLPAFPDLAFPCLWVRGRIAQQLVQMVLLGGLCNHRCLFVEAHHFLQYS